MKIAFPLLGSRNAKKHPYLDTHPTWQDAPFFFNLEGHVDNPSFPQDRLFVKPQPANHLGLRWIRNHFLGAETNIKVDFQGFGRRTVLFSRKSDPWRIQLGKLGIPENSAALNPPSPRGSLGWWDDIRGVYVGGSSLKTMIFFGANLTDCHWPPGSGGLNTAAKFCFIMQKHETAQSWQITLLQAPVVPVVHSADKAESIVLEKPILEVVVALPGLAD